MPTIYPITKDDTIYASASALRAVDTTTFRIGDTAAVAGLGVFYLDPTSTASADNTTVIAATKGNWLLFTAPYILLNSSNQIDSSQITSILITDLQQFVSINSIILASAGTWTKTRIAEGDYVYRHSVANDTSILGIDVTPQIRSAASTGFRLDSFDVIYSISSLALDAHSVTLDKVNYVNNTAVAVTSVPLTGTLATATQTNPYVSNIAVTTPAFDNTSDSKYVMEVTVDAGNSSGYDFRGVMLKFSKTTL